MAVVIEELEDEVEEEEQSTPEHMTFQPNLLEEFWSFVYDRQLVWHVRFREGRPRPWTSDLVLHENRFANIYRELDPGTRWLVENVLEKDALPDDVCFNAVMYRFMASNEDTATELGFVPAVDFVATEIEERLLPIRESGRPIFGSAYRVASCSQYGSSDHLKNALALLEDLAWDVPRLYRRIRRYNDPARWYQYIRKLPGCGPFLSHQSLVDLSMPLHRLGGLSLLGAANSYSDSYVQAGPGARAGLKRLTGSAGQGPGKIRLLTADQRDAWRRYGLDFYRIAPTYRELYPYLTDEDVLAMGKEPLATVGISLSNIEGCLCEYAKYAGIRDGTARPKRKYDHGTARVRAQKEISSPCGACGQPTTFANRVAIILPGRVWPVVRCALCAPTTVLGDLMREVS